MAEQENKCVCGDADYQHIDGDGQCAVSECGCNEFEPLEHSDDEEPTYL